MIPMRNLSRVIAVALAILMGHIWSSAVGAEDGLTIPDRPDAPVTLRLDAAAEKPEPADLLQIFTGAPEACCNGRTPVAGQYRIEDGSVIFQPAFDLIEEQAYTVRSAKGLTAFTIMSSRDIIVPRVVAIYPSGDLLPANTLRFYIHFSTPMKPHMSASFITLLDADGIADDAAFMAFKQELWSEDRKRLTLLMDPGRIKRGVAQNLSFGPALREGRQYSLVINEGWPDARGAGQIGRHEKQFEVTPALRTLPSPDLWDIRPPKTSTRTPLIIAFDRPFDHALLRAALNVQDTAGRNIRGEVSLHDYETVWQFEPQAPWTQDTLQIVIDARLEDVAGNNFRDLLDHASGTSVRNIASKRISIDLSPPP